MKTTKITTIIIIISIISILFLFALYVYGTRDEVKCVLVDKERVVTRGAKGGVESKYLIFCEDETLENSDSLLYLKFNSSDVYGELKRNEVYFLSVYGLRIPILSMYRNIISINSVVEILK